jgi:hypothetical protein
MSVKAKDTKELLIFPKTVRLGRLGSARLLRVEKNERGPVALYAVDPGDLLLFKQAVSSLKDQFNLTYQPIPALWGSWRLPDSDDDVILQVGLEHNAGKARTEALRALRSKATSIVSEPEVKALALGYLLRVGAEV